LLTERKLIRNLTLPCTVTHNESMGLFAYSMEGQKNTLSWHVPDIVMLAADKVTQLLYSLTGGRVGEKQLSYSMLLLHTVGRKSGKLRTHTLLYFRDGEDLIICASNNGSHAPPAWYLNLQAQPRVRIQHGQVRQEVIAEIVGPLPIISSMRPR